MLWANFSATLCNVTHTKSMLCLRLFLTVLQDIKWVHIKLGNPNKKSWARKTLFILFMIADYMAGVLA
jgi:hypothetical protein